MPADVPATEPDDGAVVVGVVVVTGVVVFGAAVVGVGEGELVVVPELDDGFGVDATPAVLPLAPADEPLESPEPLLSFVLELPPSLSFEPTVASSSEDESELPEVVVFFFTISVIGFVSVDATRDWM